MQAYYKRLNGVCVCLLLLLLLWWWWWCEVIETVQQVEDYVEDDEELDPLSPYVNLSNSDTTVRPTSTQIITFIENTSDGWKRNNRDEADRKRKWMRLSPGTWNDFQNQRQFSIVDETPAVIYVASATKY
jgi:hypothetical protein